MTSSVVLVAHNIRSTFNVGAIFRTCDGLGVGKIYLTGYTPYPKFDGDTRLPYIADKITKQINKTALGAENFVLWEYSEDPHGVVNQLRSDGYEIIALEQAPNSINLKDYKPTNKVGLIIGEEVEGINPELLKISDKIIEIPMHGQKESLNVSIATAICLYKLINKGSILL